MYRRISLLGFAVLLGLAATLNTALAQGTATGTLLGHLAWCKSLQRPVGQLDGEPSPLADVTPGLAQHALLPVLPAGRLSGMGRSRMGVLHEKFQRRPASEFLSDTSVRMGELVEPITPVMKRSAPRSSSNDARLELTCFWL